VIGSGTVELPINGTLIAGKKDKEPPSDGTRNGSCVLGHVLRVISERASPRPQALEPECSGYGPAACRQITDIPITPLFAALGFRVARLDGENWFGRAGSIWNRM